MRSSQSVNKYCAKFIELRDYNMYPSVFNNGPKGEDLHHFHNADRIWCEVPVASDDIYFGFISESEDAALQEAINDYKEYM